MKNLVGSKNKSEVTTLEQIEAHILETAHDIADKKLIPRQVLDRVAGSIIDIIREKSLGKVDYLKNKPLLLYKNDIKAIGDGLIVGNPVSYLTWLHRDSFNRIVFVLNVDRTLKAPFFNIPQQTKRKLIIHMDRQLLKSIEHVRAIRDDLLALTIARPLSKEEEEDEYLCSFLSSAILFGKMAFPDLEKSLSRLEFGNISLSPISLSLKINHDDLSDTAAFFRYFLPAPSSNYFMRLMLYCRKKVGALKGKPRILAHDPVFQSLQNKLERIHYIFMKWSETRLRRLGFDVSRGISIQTFKQVSILLSALSLPEIYSQEKYYPPFILSVQAKEIVSDSVAWKYFLQCPEPIIVQTEDQEEIQLKNTDEYAETSTPLQDALTAIKTLIRTPLRKKTSDDSKLSRRQQRRGIVASLNELKKQIRDSVEPADYEDLVLYVEWLEVLFSQSKPTIKTITNYAKNVEELLLVVQGKRSIITHSQRDLIPLLQKVIDRHKTPTVMRGLRSFLFFLETITKDRFKSPNWSSKELRKQEFISQKPLVFPEQLKAVCDNIGILFFRHLGRYKKHENYIENYRIASRKAENIFHLIMLTFYAGLRIKEFAQLLTNNVIYDDGIVLRVRTSKTSNGLRNIPLSRLLPEWYLDEFIAYRTRRRSVVDNGELLFPGNDGSPINQSYLTTEIARLFKSVGAPGVTAHILRHSFANWFILRWFFSSHPHYSAADSQFLRYEFYQERAIASFGRLFPKDSKEDKQSPVTHALAVLARLMGHGGPIVTIERYIHVVDWLFHFISRDLDENRVSITSLQAQQFLQATYPTLPKALTGRSKKTFSYGYILSYQREEYRRRNRQASQLMTCRDQYSIS